MKGISNFLSNVFSPKDRAPSPSSETESPTSGSNSPQTIPIKKQHSDGVYRINETFKDLTRSKSDHIRLIKKVGSPENDKKGFQFLKKSSSEYNVVNELVKELLHITKESPRKIKTSNDILRIKETPLEQLEKVINHFIKTNEEMPLIGTTSICSELSGRLKKIELIDLIHLRGLVQCAKEKFETKQESIVTLGNLLFKLNTYIEETIKEKNGFWLDIVPKGIEKKQLLERILERPLRFYTSNCIEVFSREEIKIMQDCFYEYTKKDTMEESINFLNKTMNYKILWSQRKLDGLMIDDEEIDKIEKECSVEDLNIEEILIQELVKDVNEKNYSREIHDPIYRSICFLLAQNFWGQDFHKSKSCEALIKELDKCHK